KGFWTGLRFQMTKTAVKAAVLTGGVALLVFALGALLELGGAFDAIVSPTERGGGEEGDGELSAEAMAARELFKGTDAEKLLDQFETVGGAHRLSQQDAVDRALNAGRGRDGGVSDTRRLIQLVADGRVLAEVADGGRGRENQRNFEDD
ncbi:MAG TPA: hypothetical protein VFH61_14735, partial [Thermoleophilia bacterium]|nr:hypothetical protein [Thermoleophilia bacterium]